jgi:hypothetical protein
MIFSDVGIESRADHIRVAGHGHTDDEEQTEIRVRLMVFSLLPVP